MGLHLMTVLVTKYQFEVIDLKMQMLQNFWPAMPLNLIPLKTHNLSIKGENPRKFASINFHHIVKIGSDANRLLDILIEQI